MLALAYVVFAIGCFVVAGEEIAWGQRIIGYGTPESLREINEQEEKRALLASAVAHCPLCEKTLTDQERRRVIQKLAQEVARREARIQELQREQQQLLTQRHKLRLEYKQVEQQVAQRQTLEQQYATAQASLTEATRARDSLVAVLQAYVFAILTCIYLNDALHPGH